LDPDTRQTTRTDPSRRDHGTGPHPGRLLRPTRAATLHKAVNTLVDGGQYVYVDAGHSRWRSTGETAERLIASGINRAEGFSVNVSNRQSTAEAQQWGLELSDLVGGRQFVIDTSRQRSPNRMRSDIGCR